MLEIRERPPSIHKTSTVGPWKVMPEIRERPPSTQKTLTVGSLGGDTRNPRTSTINARNVDGTPWEAVPEIQERPPSTQKMSTAGPLGGGAGHSGAPTSNTINVDGGTLGGGARDLRASTINTKKHQRRAPWPSWGSGLHPGSERCVVNLHGYDR
jgi:hypothetical protein